jgi:hypothetical protein
MKDLIKHILKEETKTQERLELLIKLHGIVNASRAVGGFNNLVKILNIDLDDIEVQASLVKDFIYYFNYIDEIRVSFIEVKNRSGRKLIQIYFDTDSTASNIDSWFARTIKDSLNDFFPFKVDVAWHPVNYPQAKIMIDAEVFKSSNEINESVLKEETALQSKLINITKKNGIGIAVRSVGGVDNYKKIMDGVDFYTEEFLQELINYYFEQIKEESEDWGLGEMSELNEVNAVNKLTITNIVKGHRIQVWADIHTNTNRWNFDYLLSEIRYRLQDDWDKKIVLFEGETWFEGTFGTGVDW